MKKSRAILLSLRIILLLTLPLMGLLAQSGTTTSEEETSENSRLVLLAEDSYLKGLELEEERKGAGRDDFLKSAAYYKTLIEERGILNEHIFFNQGNAYLNGGETGEAVLSYNRALRFAPMNKAIRYNLHQAEEKIGNRISSSSPEEIKRILFFFHYDITGKMKGLILLIMSLILWGILITGLYKPAIRRFILIPLIPALIFGTSLLVEVVSERLHPQLVLTAEKTVARKGDSASYAPAFDAPLEGGTSGKMMDEQGEWWLIRLEGGIECWIPGENAAFVDPASL
ncbi:MAG: tetratricopeptide repeat protein [Spirochaetales bacterium]|nr:tetratricopeptide repeat protein [Spirochaetales bacterium]